LPVVDAIAPDYEGEVTFLAVAGRASLDATIPRAEQLLTSGATLWTYDESIWDAYEVFGQPVTFLISADGYIVDEWSGLRSETDIRAALDGLAGTAG
jgi:hypothetical protein